MFRIYTLIILLTLSFNVQSAARALFIPSTPTPRISAIPYKVQWIPTVAGVAANSAKYVTRVVAWTPSVVGALTKPFLISPAGLALSAALVAAGYIIDQNTGEVTEPGGGGQTSGEGHQCFVWGDTQVAFASTADACIPFIQAAIPLVVATFCPTSGNCVSSILSFTADIEGTVTRHWFKMFQNDVNGTYNGDWAGGYAVFTTVPETYDDIQGAAQLNDTALGLLLDTAPLNKYLPNILTDPETGLLIDSLPLQDMLADVEADFNAQYDTDPVTVPDTDPATQDVGVETQEETLIDCDFQPTLCKWLEWTKEDLVETSPDDVPIIEDDQSQTVSWSSGFGGGACPVNPSFTFQGQTMVYDFTPACTMATWVRPIILAAALVTAGFILMGIRS